MGTPSLHSRIRRWAGGGRAADLLLALLLFALAAGRFLAAVDETPFHRDEARWVHRVYYLRLWADPLGPRWQDEGYPVHHRSLDERYRMRAHPPLGAYLLGFGLLAQGRGLATNGFWIMDRDEAWNAAHGNAPERADLLAARRANACVGAVTVACVYLIGRRLANRTAGAVAALFLIPHPLMVTLSSQALADPLLMCLLALAALAAFRLADRPTWQRALLLGALLGLGGATKLSPLLVTLPLAALGAVLVARYRRRPGRLGWMLLAVPAIALATFLAVYPHLWTDPVGNTRAMLAFRADGMALQARIWQEAAVETRTEALARVGLQLGRLDSTSGWLAAQLGARWGFAWRPDGLDLALAAIGLEILVALVVRRGLGSGTALASAVLLGAAATTIAGLRVDFYRYHLPILLAVAVCVGLAGGYAWIGLRRLVAWPAARAHRRLAPAPGFGR